MNTKILKYELFALFLLTIMTVTVFYYKDSLPDNYLTISSASDGGFISYYLISFFSYINYYTGPWLVLPCTVFTIFYAWVYSNRQDFIDTINIIPLLLTSLFFIYWAQPSFIRQGLVQSLQLLFNPFLMFTLWALSLVAFCWGTFRGSFTSKVISVTEGVRNFNYQERTEGIRNSFSSLKEKLATKKSEEQELLNYSQEELQEDLEEVETLKTEQRKENTSPVYLLEKAEMPKALEEVGEEQKVKDENEDEDRVLTSTQSLMLETSYLPVDDEEYVDESEISTFVAKEDEEEVKDQFNDDQYYNLIKLGSNSKGEYKFHQPDDKYFHDIISKVQAKLGEFKIQGQIINVLKGPVVDTFEWELGPGEKVSRLTSIAEDLSLALSGSPIRMVYPMKGRTTVGIEVPRNPRDFIFLDEIIGAKDFTSTSHHLPLAMGKDAFGEPVVVDLAAMPHMLVAGSTGAGKSVFINSVLVSLLIKKSPNQMKLILIDPKQLELALYARLPHLIMPVITEPKTAATALLWACQEMERRYTIMSEFGVRNIEGFNHKLKNAHPDAIEKIRKHYDYASEDTYELPFIVVIVDEFADLILSAKGKEIETHINRLAAKARAAGIHLIVATQRPSVDVITGVIKSNFPTRVSFRVTSSQDSRTILNAMGAEKLLGKGDMLYKYGVDTTRIHSAFIEESEIEALTDKLSEMTPSFNPTVMEFLENGGEEEPVTSVSTRDGDSSGAKDDKYDEAVRVVLEHRSASASLLQRRLGVGYNRAANLIEEMEAQGVVGPAQGSKPRKVLLAPETPL